MTTLNQEAFAKALAAGIAAYDGEARPAYTPVQFADEMREAFRGSDTETGHVCADRLMCELLESLGFADGVRIFDNSPKWYA